MSGITGILKAKNVGINNLTIMVYAPPGMGKTTLLGELPGKTLILDVDMGTSVLRGKDNIDIIRLSEDLRELKIILDEFRKEGKVPYDNICIDTITELEAGMLTVYGRNGKNDGAPEQAHYLKSQFKINDYCRQYRSLGVNFIMTAWEDQKEIIDQSGEKYTQSRPLLSGKGSDKICGLCDIVGRIIVSKKNNERYVWFQASQEVIAKDRIWGRQYCKFDELIRPAKENTKKEVA